MNSPVVRVVCVVFHPGDELATFVGSLPDACSRTVELVVVDNGTDQSVSAPVTAHAGGRLVVTGANLGYGAAANRGAAGAQSDWVVVVNPDIEWAPGALDALIEVGEADPTVGALGPRVCNLDGSVYPSARELPSLTQGAGHALFSKIWPANPWTRAYHARQEQIGDRRTAGWLSGSCLLLRRTAFEQIGGFDERYFMFFEDVDLGERLGRAGWTSLYVPQSVVTHIGGASWRATPAPMIRAHHASARRYLFSRYSHWYQAPVRAAVAVGLAAREQVQLRTGRTH